MPRPDKTIKLAQAIDQIVALDRKTRGVARQSIPNEILDAIDFLERAGVARNRGEALLQLALPAARDLAKDLKEAVEKVQSTYRPDANLVPVKSQD